MWMNMAKNRNGVCMTDGQALPAGRLARQAPA